MYTCISLGFSCLDELKMGLETRISCGNVGLQGFHPRFSSLGVCTSCVCWNAQLMSMVELSIHVLVAWFSIIVLPNVMSWWSFEHDSYGFSWMHAKCLMKWLYCFGVEKSMLHDWIELALKPFHCLNHLGMLNDSFLHVLCRVHSVFWQSTHWCQQNASRPQRGAHQA